MKLDLRSLLAGEIRSLPLSFVLTPACGEDELTSPLYGVSFPEGAAVSGEIVNTAGYIVMSLSISAPYIAPCARCLADVSGSFVLEVKRTVLTPDQAIDIDETKEEDYVVTEGGFLDADELLTELFEMNFPSKLLCREDCLGLCSLCGKDLNEGPCACTQESEDPRLAPLKKILEELQAKEAGSEGSRPTE